MAMFGGSSYYGVCAGNSLGSTECGTVHVVPGGDTLPWLFGANPIPREF